MKDDFTPTEYQRRVLDSTHQRRILIGGRQIGKTEVVVRDAIERALDNEIVVLPAYQQKLVKMLIERAREICEERYLSTQCTRTEIDFDVGGRILGISTWQYNAHNFDGTFADYVEQPLGFKTVDAFLVDEANWIDERILFEIDRYSSNPDVLLTATPYSERTIVDIWAENARHWETIHARMYDADYIHEENIDAFRESLSDEQVQFEVEGVYERETRP